MSNVRTCEFWSVQACSHTKSRPRGNIRNLEKQSFSPFLILWFKRQILLHIVTCCFEGSAGLQRRGCRHSLPSIPTDFWVMRWCCMYAFCIPVHPMCAPEVSALYTETTTNLKSMSLWSQFLPQGIVSLKEQEPFRSGCIRVEGRNYFL